jgi:hypothetical protein
MGNHSFCGGKVSEIRLSIIIPFLNSWEIVRRQVLWFHKLDLPDSVETIFMDDGSDPPIVIPNPPRNFRLIATNDKRPWTSSLARNAAAKIAKGKYFLMTDGDYIIPRAAVDHALEFDGDRQGFRRFFGVLDENGDLHTEHEALLKWGVSPDYLAKRNGKISPHPNNFIIRREVFEMIGGYRENFILEREYPQGEDRWFKRDLMRLAEEGKIKLPEIDNRPTIYMHPHGQFCGDVDANPFGLFHNLSRKTENNFWYMKFQKPRYPV